MPLRMALIAVLLAARCLAAPDVDGKDPAPGRVSVSAAAPATATAGPDSCLLLGQRVRVRYEERGHESILPFLRIPSTRRGEIVGEMVGGDARELRVRTAAGDGAAVGALFGLLGREDVWERVDRDVGISVAPDPDAGVPKICLLITQHFE